MCIRATLFSSRSHRHRSGIGEDYYGFFTKALLRVDFFFLFLLQKFFFFFFFVSFPSQKNRDHHHVDASKKSSVFFFRRVDDCVRVGGGRVVFLVFRCVRFRFWRVSSSSPFRKRQHVRFLSFVEMNPIVETCQRCSFPRRSTPKGPPKAVRPNKR